MIEKADELAKVTNYSLSNFIIKETPAQVLSPGFCENLRTHIFKEQLHWLLIYSVSKYLFKVKELDS